jgi:hypothetical protein
MLQGMAKGKLPAGGNGHLAGRGPRVHVEGSLAQNPPFVDGKKSTAWQPHIRF